MKTQLASITIGLFALSGFLITATAQQNLHGHVPDAVTRLHLQPIDRLPATNHLKLSIGMPWRNIEELTKVLREIYDPVSANYHHYLTSQQFAEKFGPSEQDYQAVMAFVKKSGLTVTGTHPNRALIDVDGTVTDVEEAFHLRMQSYQHPVEARTFFAPDAEPSIDLAIPISGISGLDDYNVPRPMILLETRSKQPNGATPATGSAPDGFSYMGYDFRNAYVPSSSLTGSGQAIGLFQLDGYYPSDITRYEQLNGLPKVTLQNVALDGVSVNNPGYSGIPDAVIEVSLDIEMAISMAPGISQVIIYEGSTPLHILNRMITDNLAKQLSSSWFWNFEGSVDLISSQLFQQMAAQGQTFFQASGDFGAYYNGVSQWAGSSNVTLVGGTILSTAAPSGSWSSETAWSNSGGGFRPTYTLPTWQQGLSSSANQGSATQRNVPDVAMVADFVWVIYGNGVGNSCKGTSIGAPLWAGFTALVNQQLVAAGWPTMGATMNPLIYNIGTSGNYASCFHDITSGNNENSGSPTMFSAVAGYDLCTGWGTPRGINLINEMSFLPDLTKGSDSLSTAVIAGNTLTPSISINNQYCAGGYAPTGPFHIGFYLSTSSSFAGISPFYETAITSGCAAGGAVAINPTIPISASTTPGTYYFGYEIDDRDEVIECNKNNNGIYYWTITVQAPTRIIGLTGNLAFGNEPVGSAPQSALTINNTGNSTITISSISYPSGFSGNWPSGTIAAGGSQPVMVTFSPTSPDTYAGTVTVYSDATSGVNTIAASGTGTMTATKIISLSGNLAFGNAAVGSSSQSTLTINNTGTATLTVSSISYPGGFSGNWSGTIAPNGSQPVTVTFSPTSATVYSGTVTVNSDATSGGNTITASGTGASSNVVFADNFTGTFIDATKWTISGDTVLQTNDTMEVLTTITDKPGTLTSQPFAIANTGLITITRQVFLHHDDSIYYLGNNHFFTGVFIINVSNVPTFSAEYCDYDYSGDGRQPAYGFFINRNGAEATSIADQSSVSPGITALWDTWFNEKITYDPSSGQLQYYTNNTLAITFNVGSLPSQTSPKMSLYFQAYGWWTGHEQLFQNLVVSQVAPVTLPPQLTGATVSTNGMFLFNLNGPSGSNYVIQASVDLVNWVNQITNTVPSGGTLPYAFPIQSNQPQKFYRALPLH